MILFFKLLLAHIIGDLSKAKDCNLTEYVLIGTLLSFGFAIATGFVYNYLIDISPILK